MKTNKNLWLILLAIAALSCKKGTDNMPAPPVVKPPVVITPYVPDNSFKIVAYMPSYQNPETVDIGKYKMITHLFYAFLNPNVDGTLAALAAPTNFTTVMQRAKANGVKFGISVSGLSATFATMASSATARNTFTKNVLAFARNNNLDGVDMDWEYPTTTAPTSSADNFTLLMKELSDSLHKYQKFLSAAVTPAVYAGGFRDGVKAEVYPYVDFFNIMQYDGQTYEPTDINQHASYNMSVKSLDIWLNTKGLPKEKAVCGMPVYGRNTTGGALTYRAIEASGNDMNLNKGTVNGVDYWFNGIPMIKQKTQLAKDRANGIMFWEFAQDSNTANSLLKAANDQLGRAY
jgi:chitinase